MDDVIMTNTEQEEQLVNAEFQKLIELVVKCLHGVLRYCFGTNIIKLR